MCVCSHRHTCVQEWADEINGGEGPFICSIGQVLTDSKACVEVVVISQHDQQAPHAAPYALPKARYVVP